MSRTANPALSLCKPPGPKAEIRLLWVNSARGLIWSMNCDNWDEPKNSFNEATNGLVFNKFNGVKVSESCKVILSLTILSILDKPTLNWFWRSSPTERILLFPKWSISSREPSSYVKLIKYSIDATISWTVRVLWFLEIFRLSFLFNL